jgi:hypothetical protein
MAAPGHVAVNNDLPYEYAAALTKSDSTTFTATRALYVSGTGDVAVAMSGDAATAIFKAVPAGTILKVRATKLLSTGTSATDVIALW